MIYIGKVLSIKDDTGGDNIYTYIGNIDSDEKLTKDKKTFPLLPKYIQTKPKKNENVIILTIEGANENEMPIQRFYVGPIISHRQKLKGDSNSESLATTNLGKYGDLRNIEYTPEANGCFGKEDELSLYGRGKSDIILGEDNIRIRCGSRLDSFDSYGTTFKFNTIDPAFMHMQYYSMPIKAKKIVWDDNKKKIDKEESWVDSVTTISAQEINLVSTANFNTELTSGRTDMITDENMSKIIEKAHPMVYGDELVQILYSFRDAINNHVHGWGPTPANKFPTPELIKINQLNFGTMLSKHVRVG